MELTFIETPEGDAGNFMDVMNADNTIEMDTIRVSRLPDCGTMQWRTAAGVSVVDLETSYDISGNTGIFIYVAPIECSADEYDNSWTYYYERAAVGLS